MAAYYISDVHQENEVIKKVKTCTSYSTSGPSAKIEKTRESVVSDLESKKDIFTIYKNSKGDWALGEYVQIEIIDGKKYIKTKANGKKCDNLDNIAQY